MNSDEQRGEESEAKFTTSRHRTRNAACIVAYIAVDFRSESSNRNDNANRVAKVIFIALHKSLASVHLEPCNSAIRIVGPIASRTCIARFGELWSETNHGLTGLNKANKKMLRILNAKDLNASPGPERSL